MRTCDPTLKGKCKHGLLSESSLDDDDDDDDDDDGDDDFDGMTMTMTVVMMPYNAIPLWSMHLLLRTTAIDWRRAVDCGHTTL